MTTETQTATTTTRRDHVAAESLVALYHNTLQPGDTSRYDAYARVRDALDMELKLRSELLAVARMVVSFARNTRENAESTNLLYSAADAARAAIANAEGRP
jgi:hypothetical protein